MLKIPRIQPHQGGLHRRRPDHPRHRRRAFSRSGCCSTPPSLRYQALFSEAGGLAAGNDVTVSGIKVGTVSSIELDNGDALVAFTIDRQVRARLGNHRAHPHRNAARRAGIGPGVRGHRHARPQVRSFPRPRTSSPYSLTDAVSDLTANTAATDTDSLNQSLDTLADDARPDRATTGPDLRRAVADCRGRSTIATRVWPSCSRPLGT